jgi:hypothetical protein
MLLANIKASDQAILDLENMACLLIEQRVPVQIARSQMNLDAGCSILADRKPVGSARESIIAHCRVQ